MKVFLHDEFPPETSAMMQALYSRSGDSVEKHAALARDRGPDKFMASYYVGYGHASIGDCGVTTLYLEDISLIACKAVQDNPLYSGQETSTRYIDFSNRGFVDPLGTQESRAHLLRWLEFYSDLTKPLTIHLKTMFPLPQGQTERVWEKAIAARAFDIARGFLPAGVMSQMSWTTNLRQAHEHVARLEHHPLAEVRSLGSRLRALLASKYPSSFGHKVAADELEYLQRVAQQETYYIPADADADVGYDSLTFGTTVCNASLEKEALALISLRPRRSTLPKTLARFGHYLCRFLLDYGSFRDLQRHRGGHCRVPLLSARFGFHDWYVASLPPELRKKATEFLLHQQADLDKLWPRDLPQEEKQYYFPIGTRVLCEIMYDLPQMVYVAELRSGQTVHPTLRVIAHQLASALHRNHPRLKLFIDDRADEFSIKRGTQDIEARPAA